MLLSAIGHREIPIPDHIDIYHLTREMDPSDKTALQCVMEVDEERLKLEKEAERLAHEDGEWEPAYFLSFFLFLSLSLSHTHKHTHLIAFVNFGFSQTFP